MSDNKVEYLVLNDKAYLFIFGHCQTTRSQKNFPVKFISFETH